MALRAEIAVAGIKQWRIAHRVGISEGQLSHILKGNRTLTPELAAEIRSAIRDLAA